MQAQFIDVLGYMIHQIVFFGQQKYCFSFVLKKTFAK